MFSYKNFFRIKKIYNSPRNWIIQKKRNDETEHYKKEDKRTSQFSSNNGYMTVEASIVVPIFFIIMMGFALWIQVFMVEAEVQKGVIETGKYMARQIYKYEKLGDESQLVSKFSNIMIKNKWKDYVDDSFLEKSCLLDGIDGVSFQNSKYDENSGNIKINAKYKIQILLPFVGIYQLSMNARAEQKAFTGYKNSNTEYVYVAESGKVFHTNRKCTHIALSIIKVYDTEKYISGKTGYTACERCTQRYEGTSPYFYITKYGKKYHTSLQCSSLKRTIQKVKLGEVKGLGQCLKCQEQAS